MGRALYDPIELSIRKLLRTSLIWCFEDVLCGQRPYSPPPPYEYSTSQKTQGEIGEELESPFISSIVFKVMTLYESFLVTNFSANCKASIYIGTASCMCANYCLCSLAIDYEDR